MPCFRPVEAFVGPGGAIVFSRKAGFEDLSPVQLPCGKCVGCRSKRKRDWAIRITQEASMHDRNCVVTLTYSDECLPEDGNLCHRDFQLFARSMRKAGIRFSYFMCGEYGGRFGRPHYHAILFGIDFSEDRYFWEYSSAKTKQYRSPTLEKFWKHGNSTIGDFNDASAFYVVGYLLKANQPDDYFADPEDPVDSTAVQSRVPEYARMSTRPAIGRRYFEKWRSEIFPRDAVVFQGCEYQPPRYYVKRLSELEKASVKKRRLDAMVERRADSTPDRLAVREAVFKAKRDLSKG